MVKLLNCPFACLAPVFLAACTHIDASRSSVDSDAEPLHELKVLTINTGSYSVKGADRRSVHVVAPEDMHIVAISHFIGVQSGTIPSDNGHILSKLPENPWEKWADAPTGMEPTGASGYFGYCGRDYYSECSGIQDVQFHENLPVGCCFLVKKGEKLYMHCYAAHGLDTRAFHHAVRLYYW